MVAGLPVAEKSPLRRTSHPGILGFPVRIRPLPLLVALGLALPGGEDQPHARGGDAGGARSPFALRARLVGALGPGFHLTRESREDGVEDFLRLPHAIPLARYEVDVAAFAGLRLVGRTVELLDEGGAPRVRMEPPWIASRDGVHHDVDVDVVDCAIDRDPRAPWGRPVVAPGRAACTVELRWTLPDEAYPAVLDPGWTETRSLAAARALHSATRLLDGRVLVAAGYGGGADLASSELFDPATGTFAATGALAEARRAHVAVRLVDGRVVAIGGDAGLGGGQRVLASVERFDPATGQWTTLPPLSVARTHHAVVTLGDGRVLVAGSFDYGAQDASASVEICAPDGTGCVAGPPMGNARADHTATTLTDGRVLVTGGGARIFSAGGTLYATTEIFRPTPAPGAWAAGPPLPAARIGHVALRRADGSVLLIGGSLVPQGETLTDEVLVVDAAAAGVSLAGRLSTGRWLHAASPLPSGRVLVTGTATPFYQPSTRVTSDVVEVGGATTPGGDLVATHFHTSTELADGRVLVVGGSAGASQSRRAFVFEEARPPVVDAGADAASDAGALVPDAGGAPPDAGSVTGPSVSNMRDETSFYGCAASRRPTRGAWLGAPLSLLLFFFARRSHRHARAPLPR